MERRVLLAIFLAVLWCCTASRRCSSSRCPSQRAAAPRSRLHSCSAARQSTPEPAARRRGVEPVAPAPATTVPLARCVGETAERDVRVETRDVIAVFTNRGARLKSWRLKHYFDRQSSRRSSCEPMLPTHAAAVLAAHGDDAVTATLNDGALLRSAARRRRRPSHRRRSALRVPRQRGRSRGQGIPSRAGLVHRHRSRDRGHGGDRAVTPAIVWGPGVGDIAESEPVHKTAGGLLLQNGKVQRLAPNDIAKQPVHDGEFQLRRRRRQLLHGGRARRQARARSRFSRCRFRRLPARRTPRALWSRTRSSRRGDAPLKFFFGPKDFDVLDARSIATSPRAIDFGMFAMLVVPLLRR